VKSIEDFPSLYKFIIWLYNGRCINCYTLATDISHIETGHDDSDWHKIVLHCRECHRKYHDNGVSDEAIEMLVERRIEYLEMIGREEYI